MQDANSSVRRFSGFSEIAENYDAVICDIWGVVHNGKKAFPAAVGALGKYRRHGGTVILVTNAPRPNPSIKRQLDGLGVPDSSYDAIVTSGDVTQKLLTTRYAGANAYHLGPERDVPLFSDIALTITEEAAADVILCTGLLDDETETPDNYRELLARFSKRGLELICANPDKIVERGEKLIYCAGALSDLYAELGGRTIVLGKPHAPIYEAAIARIAELRGVDVEPGKTLAIGDSVRTDVAGAAAQGFDTLFITDGIHTAELGKRGQPDPTKVAALLSESAATPVGYLPSLVW